jgi:hypothetical protein
MKEVRSFECRVIHATITQTVLQPNDSLYKAAII